MKRTFSLLFVLVVLIGGVAIKNVYLPEPKFVGVINKVMPATVDIKVIIERRTEDGGYEQKQIEGSGVYISPKGFILTCGHLFKASHIESINITNYYGETVSGKLLKVNYQRDLALLRTYFYEVTPYILLVNPTKVKVGQEVFAIGSPLGFDFSVSNGIISGMYRDVDLMYNMLQTNTAINPGNSGGPLFNLQGELVGINSFIMSPVQGFPIFTGLGFAVSPAECLTFLVRCGKTIPEIRSYQWLRVLLSSLGSKSLEP